MVNKNKKRNEKLPKENIILVIFEIYLNENMRKCREMVVWGRGRYDDDESWEKWGSRMMDFHFFLLCFVFVHFISNIGKWWGGGVGWEDFFLIWNFLDFSVSQFERQREKERRTKSQMEAFGLLGIRKMEVSGKNKKKKLKENRKIFR